MRFDQHFILGILPEAMLPYTVFPSDISFAVDTRALKPGDIFVALPGAKEDGHLFCAQAIAAGASGLLIAVDRQNVLNAIDSKVLKNKVVIIVPDTLMAFIKLATAWRSQFNYPVVGITGSVGKTSTKETLAAICATAGIPVMKAEGSQNTKVGIALNIFKMRTHHRVAIFEMGISKRGEMAELANILRPTTAIITSIGHAHMEGLGSLADIAQEKRDIFKYFNDTNIGVINGDQAILAHVAYAHPVVKFGCKTINQVQARKIQTGTTSINFILKLYRQKYTVTLHNVHQGAVMNSLAAAAVSYLLQIPAEAIIEGLQKSVQVKGRFEERPLAHFKGLLIHDCYNANPESMKAALLAFQRIDTKAQKIAVLGDMLELGVTAPFWHRQLGRFLRKVPTLQHVILVGSLVSWTKKTVPVGITVEHVATWQDAVAKLEERLQTESMILVKGSRGIALDKLVERFTT